MSLLSLPLALAGVAASAEPSLAVEANYRCSGGSALTARFSPPGTEPGHVVLSFGTGHSVTLPQQLSADGGRYAGDGIEFWIKGRDATLRRGGGSETCSTS
ncbi:hypothetical protein ASE63_22085 [Bosea sp. Root381]|nr:hypothetical protein ASE63_22085 [Bosea sp. Root381]